MRRLLTLLACIGMVLPAATLIAQVPHVLTYQGRVTSGGTNFSGTGQFKFALVSGGTTAAAPASGSATVYFGFVVQIAVTSGGAGYITAPSVTITDSSGSGAIAVAHVANGQVTDITVTDAGSGYSANPTITIAPPPANLSYTSYWSHDGSSSAGGEPASAVAVSVNGGLFTVGLGDTLIPNMTALPPQTLANPDVRLRIWFNDGVNGFSQLSPDQRLTSAAYAMLADTVRDGAITAAKLAPGSITAAQIADGSITAAKLATNSNIATPSGSIVMSQDANAANLLASGYVKISGAKVLTEEWEVIATQNPALGEASGSSSVFTGEEMVFLGDNPFYGGARYSFQSNSWNIVSSNNAPEPRYRPTLVWTGTKVIMWGGLSYDGNTRTVATGGMYDPKDDYWSDTSLNGAPTHRRNHVAVWSGTEMIVWGGFLQSNGTPTTVFNTGARFNPVLNRWTQLPTTGAPSPRYGAFAAWIGTGMLVWGGNGTNNAVDQNSGAIYIPSSDRWVAISPPPFTPPASYFATALSEPRSAIWTGTEMVFWNGAGGYGARYNPSTDTWRLMNRSGPKNESFYPSLMGNKVVYLFYPDVPSAVYDLPTDTWSLMSPPNGILAEGDSLEAVAWAGSLFAFNKIDLTTVGKFTPRPPLFLYQKP